MIEFKIKTKKHKTSKKTEAQSIQCVDSWTEVTVKHWQELSNHHDSLDMIRVFSVFTGLDYDMLMNSPDGELTNQISKSLNWFYEADENYLTDLDLPSHVIHNGIAIPIPTNLGAKTIGQKLILSKYLENKDLSYSDLIPVALSVYLEPEYRRTKLELDTGKSHLEFTDEQIRSVQFNWERGEPFIEECMGLKLVEAYPVARFFLTS